MTTPNIGAALDRALTVGGIGRSDDLRLTPVTQGIYAKQYAKACDWKRTELRSSSRTFTPEQVAQYALWLRQQGYARSTAGLAVRAIRWGHRVAGEPVPDGLPASYVLRDGQSTPEDHPDVNDLDPSARRGASEVLAAFVAGCRTDTIKGRRDLAIVHAFYWGGLSADQVSALNLDDVQYAPGVEFERHDVWLARPGGEGMHIGHLPEPGHYRSMCGACAISDWHDLLYTEYGQGPDTPLFRNTDRGHNVAGTLDRAGGNPTEGGRLRPRGLMSIVMPAIAAEAGLYHWTPSPARALRIAGAVAAYSAGAISLPQAALRAGFLPGSAKFRQHLLDMTAPEPMGTTP